MLAITGESHSKSAHQMSILPRQSKPLVQFLLIGIFVGIVTIVNVALLASTDGGDRGFVSLRSGHDFKSLYLFRLFAIQVPLNILAGLLVIFSDYVREYMLSPPTDAERNPNRDFRYQSFSAWKRATVYRKALWIVLLSTELFIHSFFNSLVLSSTPSYDAYEILVDQSFFTGVPFNLSSLNMTHFGDQDSLLMPLNTSSPSRWPGEPQLYQLLEGVQVNPSHWKNLSAPDCKRTYGLDPYSDYRTVILVTHWDQPNNTANSVLAIGALSGFPVTEVANRFVSLCPPSYIAETPGAYLPDSTPYVGTIFRPGDCRGPSGPSQHCVDGKGPSDMSLYENVGLRDDLCYGYRPAVSHKKPYDISQQLPLLYCLSEPIPEATARIIWIKPITSFICIALGINALAVLLTWPCIRYDRGFKGGYPWFVVDKICSHHIAIGLYITINLAIGVFTMCLAIKWSITSGRSTIPVQTTHGLLAVPIIAFPNILHALLRLRAYFDRNEYQLRMAQKPRSKRDFKFDLVFFCWNLAMHMLVSAWISSSLTDRYSLALYDNPRTPPTTNVVWESHFNLHNLRSDEITAGLPVADNSVFWFVAIVPVITAPAIRYCISVCAGDRRGIIGLKRHVNTAFCGLRRYSYRQTTHQTTSISEPNLSVDLSNLGSHDNIIYALGINIGTDGHETEDHKSKWNPFLWPSRKASTVIR